MRTSPNRLLQFATVAIIGIFVLGFVSPPLGAWTGAVLNAWFIGTQKAWRGFLLLVGIDFILHLFSKWSGSPLTEIEHAGWMMLAVLISVLPFLLYRLTSQRRQGFLSTLSLPLWGVALQTLGQLFFPTRNIQSLLFVSHLLVRGGDQLDVEPGIPGQEDCHGRKYFRRGMRPCLGIWLLPADNPPSCASSPANECSLCVVMSFWRLDFERVEFHSA